MYEVTTDLRVMTRTGRLKWEGIDTYLQYGEETADEFKCVYFDNSHRAIHIKVTQYSLHIGHIYFSVDECPDLLILFRLVSDIVFTGTTLESQEVAIDSIKALIEVN